MRLQLDDANLGDAEVIRILGELSPSTAKNYVTSAVLYYSRSPLLSLNDSVQKVLSKVNGMDGLLQSIHVTVASLCAGVTPSRPANRQVVAEGPEESCELDGATHLQLKSLLAAAEI